MATASFGKWRNYYNKAWFSEKANTSSSNTNFTDNIAGYGAWSVVKITTGAVTGGNKLGTMTVKIGLGKYSVYTQTRIYYHVCFNAGSIRYPLLS